jgi:methionyl-tRNA formyltransferase
VKILTLQPAGKSRMTAEEFMRGHPLKEGDRFGPEQLAD